VVGLFGNLVLMLGKLSVGFLAQSASLIADGFHSLSDLLGDVGVLIALKASKRPPDRNHPYGHHSFETLGALGVSLLILVTGVLIGQDAVLRLLRGENLEPRMPALVAALVAAGLKELMARYTFAASKIHHSPALEANASMHRYDALTSLAAAGGILGALAGLPSLDSVAALLIALFILKSGWDLSRSNVMTLMDTMPSKEYLTEIRQVAEAVEGVRGVPGLRVRQRGSRYLADVRIQVDAQLTVASGHDLAHKVEVALRQQVSTLTQVFVHVEPAPTDASDRGDRRG
jgi:cation diffusion facilitator family transporter